MLRPHQFSLSHGGVAFVVTFGLCVGLGNVLSFARPVMVAPHTSSERPKELLIPATLTLGLRFLPLFNGNGSHAESSQS